MAQMHAHVVWQLVDHLEELAVTERNTQSSVLLCCTGNKILIRRDKGKPKRETQ
jgi:hypothetical protein